MHLKAIYVSSCQELANNGGVFVREKLTFGENLGTYVGRSYFYMFNDSLLADFCHNREK